MVQARFSNAIALGRTTMQQHFAEEGEFIAKSGKTAGSQDVFVARRARSPMRSLSTRSANCCGPGATSMAIT